MPERINLLYLIPSLGTGGTERLVTDLVTHLDPDRFSVAVCVQQDGLFGQHLTRRGYPVHLLTDSCNASPLSPVRKLRALVGRVRCLRALIARERIDIVHTHHLGPLLHAFLDRKSTRLNSSHLA